MMRFGGSLKPKSAMGATSLKSRHQVMLDTISCTSTLIPKEESHFEDSRAKSETGTTSW